MTVGKLKKLLETVPDDIPLFFQKEEKIVKDVNQITFTRITRLNQCDYLYYEDSDLVQQISSESSFKGVIIK